jgi:hypothetical protein
LVKYVTVHVALTPIFLGGALGVSRFAKNVVYAFKLISLIELMITNKTYPFFFSSAKY